MENILEVNNLSIAFESHQESKQVVHEVSYQLKKNEILGIVGESGSGKSVSSLAILGLLPKKQTVFPSGEILFKGENMVEFGRPAPEGLDDFYDCYFKGDPAVIEAHFSMTERRGTYDTFHGVTIKDGAVVRKKQYIFNSQTRFADWDVMHLQLQKRKLAE